MMEFARGAAQTNLCYRTRDAARVEHITRQRVVVLLTDAEIDVDNAVRVRGCTGRLRDSPPASNQPGIQGGALVRLDSWRKPTTSQRLVEHVEIGGADGVTTM